MTPEGIVVAAVEQYFSQPKFQRFSIRQEYPIQMGADNRRADVVLFDRKLPSDKNNLSLNAITECKRLGVEKGGPEQLRSYLCATDTPLGIFANSTEPDDWKFYKNLGQNQIDEITRPEFERRLVNPIVSMLNFFRRSFHTLSKGGSGEKTGASPDKPPPDKSNSGEPNEKSIVPLEPPIHYRGESQPLQNEYTENTVEPSLNDKPYYSEDNGFSCAAAFRGMPEALPEHIGIIIRNEQLEIAASWEQLQTELNQLDEEKNKLELQKHDHEQQINRITQELSTKRTKRTELEAELEMPTNAELNQLPEVDQSPENSTKMQLQERIRKLEREIREKTQEHTEKKKKLVSLKVELKAPTKAELDLVDTEVPIKQRFSWRQLITASIATIFLVPLTFYLFVFYASVVDKAFFLDVASLKGKSQDALNAIDIVNSTALTEAFQRPWNPVVILFPSIFLAFAIVAHYFWEQRKWTPLGAILLFTLLFDFILAIQISQKIHEVKKIAGLILESDTGVFRINDLNMWTVIFCGFVVSLLVSVLYHAAVELWKGARPLKDESKQLKMKIRAEKNPHQIQLATLKTEVKKLKKDIDQLNNEHAICKRDFGELSNRQLQAQIKAEKHPIKVQIAILKTEMQNLQRDIDSLNENIKNTQQEIAEYQTQIETLLERQRTKVIDLKKMDLQVSQFVSGWCKYVTQSEIDLTEVPEKIETIREIKQETLESHFKNLRSYVPITQENFLVEDGS